MTLDNADLAREAYEWTQSLPQTETCRDLQQHSSIIIDGCSIGSNDYPEICFVNRIPSVIKNVTKKEYNLVDV